MSESIPMLFEDCHGRPTPRLMRDPEGKPRVADGARYFSLDQAAVRFKMPAADLEQFWFDVWEELMQFDNGPDRGGNSKADWLKLVHDHKHTELCDEHFDQLVEISEKFNFDLWAREIYGKITHNALTGRPEMTPCIGIYGLRKRAHASGQHGGCDAPVWEPSEDERHPSACRVTVYRLVNGQRQAHTATVFWNECAPEPGTSDFWDRQPFTALEYRAEAKALRKAFGEFVGGFSLFDEVPQGGGGGSGKAMRRRGDESQGTQPVKPGEEPPTTRIGFEIAARSMGFVDDRHRGQIIAMIKSKYAALFENDERIFWTRAYDELKRNPRRYAPPTAM